MVGASAAGLRAAARARRCLKDAKVRVIVGKVHEDPPAFHQEFVVDGHRFPLEFNRFFGGYEQRRDGFPESWLDRVSVKVQRYGSYWGWNSKHDCGSHGG